MTMTKKNCSTYDIERVIFVSDYTTIELVHYRGTKVAAAVSKNNPGLPGEEEDDKRPNETIIPSKGEGRTAKLGEHHFQLLLQLSALGPFGCKNRIYVNRT